jgi:chromosome partitioning protein
MVISPVNQKVGVDKTTIAINLCNAPAKKKQKILLIAADPQGSIQWQAIAANRSFVVIHRPLSGLQRR